jgi:hypothetical protein
LATALPEGAKQLEPVRAPRARARGLPIYRLGPARAHLEPVLLHQENSFPGLEGLQLKNNLNR